MKIKKTHQTEFYQPKFIDMWPFKWSEFETEIYKNDQKFILILKNYKEIITSYDDMIDNPYLTAVGITHYLPINLGGVL